MKQNLGASSDRLGLLVFASSFVAALFFQLQRILILAVVCIPARRTEQASTTANARSSPARRQDDACLLSVKWSDSPPRTALNISNLSASVSKRLRLPTFPERLLGEPAAIHYTGFEHCIRKSC